MLRHPPDILITTPESLYLLLTSSAREILTPVRWVIVDEVHAVAGTKRGSHLALTLERLEEITAVPPQRIGLSATQRPLEAIARFLAGGTIVRRRLAAPAGHRGRRPTRQAPRGRDRGAGRGHDPARARPARPGAGHPAAPLHLARHVPAVARTGPGPPLHHHLRQQPHPGRAARRPAQHPRRRGDRQGASRLRVARAAPVDRERPQDGVPARRGRHLLAGTGHRHGGRRPRGAGRVAGDRGPRPAAGGPRRAPGRQRPAGPRCSPSTAATCSRRRCWCGAWSRG